MTELTTVSLLFSLAAASLFGLFSSVLYELIYALITYLKDFIQGCREIVKAGQPSLKSILFTKHVNEIEISTVIREILNFLYILFVGSILIILNYMLLDGVRRFAFVIAFLTFHFIGRRLLKSHFFSSHKISRLIYKALKTPILAAFYVLIKILKKLFGSIKKIINAGKKEKNRKAIVNLSK